MPVPALDVARYLVEHADAEDDLSNLKLQKLCHYAQGFALAVWGRELFDEPVERWQHGPVVSVVYHAYKHWDRARITEPTDGEPLADEQARELLDAVYKHYSQYSAWALRERTHREPPWKEASQAGADYLSRDTTARFFGTQLHLICDPADSNPAMPDQGAMMAEIQGDAELAESTRRGRADFEAGRFRRISA